MRRMMYPIRLDPDEAGGFVVTFPDLPEAITQGDTRAEALDAAADCLEEALAGRIVEGEDIPPPAPGRPRVAPGVVIAAKAALYSALKECGASKSHLARRLGVDVREVRRLLDPRHPSKLPRLDAALAVLGKRLVIEIHDAA